MPSRLAKALLLPLWLCAVLTQAAHAEPDSPAAFLPGGLLGLHPGDPWGSVKKRSRIKHLDCAPPQKHAELYDEICFFKTHTEVAGAPIHDGFVVRKGHRVILIGTGIAIKNVDDPLAETVMRRFQTQVHAWFQHDGDDVLFVNMPQQLLSQREFDTFSQTAPVLLVELQPEGTELAVMYGYLAPVNTFSQLGSDQVARAN